MNPITATDIYESIINRNIYETLTKRDNKTLDLKPLLAESWEISADKLRYKFKLKSNIKWQDGIPFTSKDVVFSYKSIINPSVDAPHLRNYYKDIIDVKAINDHTVEFIYSKPYFLALEFCGGMPIVPSHLFNKKDITLPEIGEGIKQASVISVFISHGDSIQKEQPVIEIETDKAAIELPSPYDGTVSEVAVKVGDTIGIGQLIAKVNKDFNKNPNGRKPIGTGPYKFSKWNTGSEVVLERNENYWGEKPKLQKIVFKIINDRTVAFQVLKRGDLDYYGLTPIQWDRQSNTRSFKEKFNKYRYFRPNYSFIGWNMNKPYFKDKKVRTAMTHLLDRELILNKILLGLGAIITNPFYINSPEYDKSIQHLNFDPEKARKLLDEAGWIDHDNDGVRDRNGVKFEFEFLLPSGSETGEKIATILKEELDKTGIVMKIRKTEWAVFTTRLNERRFDAVTLGWSMGVESDPYQIWSSTQAESGSNFIGFKNKKADELISKARREFDRKKRIDLYQKFAKIVHKEQPYTFLFCSESTVAVNNRFKNVTVYPLGLDPVEWYIPKSLQKYY